VPPPSQFHKIEFNNNNNNNNAQNTNIQSRITENKTGNIQERSRHHYCGQARSFKYYECVSVFFALDILHAKSMRLIALSPVTCLDLPHLFFTLSHN